MGEKGKFIVFYGINNLGKSTQAFKLVEKLNQKGKRAEYLKYPVYDLDPSGLLINNYLREDNKFNLSRKEAQILYTMNRFQYEPILKEKLSQGINIISEDYTGTGLAWGITTGVEENFLKRINKKLLKEDLAFLFDGERFEESEEKNHKHETNGDFMKKARQIHLRLGQEYNWKKINANLSREEIHKQIFKEVNKII